MLPCCAKDTSRRDKDTDFLIVGCTGRFGGDLAFSVSAGTEDEAKRRVSSKETDGVERSIYASGTRSISCPEAEPWLSGCENPFTEELNEAEGPKSWSISELCRVCEGREREN